MGGAIKKKKGGRGKILQVYPLVGKGGWSRRNCREAAGSGPPGAARLKKK